MEHPEVAKGTTFTTSEIVQFDHKKIVVRSIINRPTGNLSIVAIDTGQVMDRKSVPFDTYLQVIEGLARLSIGNQTFIVKNGQSIIIPARIQSTLTATIRLKIFLAIIKTGNENTGVQ
ncbi:hypothetical protein [Roseivirga sp. UBA838]|uniref:hypothetical protein n=1 Tax=Roseivirga sp. UBA838 TaxID=1947393 RepID=UPI00257CC948|nr:hypothetical protein [Roseivirga sp. UBA838]|tara:strand:+ start:50754 stop:51107 length:354 start_codon:yes stop_codon:yes gene_type:complete